MTISFVVGGGSKTTADFSASLRNDKQKDRRNDKQGDGRNDKQRDRQKMTNKMSGNRECKATADFSARLLTRCVSSFGRNDVSLWWEEEAIQQQISPLRCEMTNKGTGEMTNKGTGEMTNKRTSEMTNKG
jgi:hypothetical protein